MAPTFSREKPARGSRTETADPFAEQLQLSRVHARLVPMRRSGIGIAIDPAAADWYELPASRGFAGFGLPRALGLLLDAMRGLSALHATNTASGQPFAHGEFAPLHFRVDPLGVCRLVPLTARHYISEEVPPPQAALGFLSPERLIAEKVGVRADVFSAGVLLWEALAGRRLVEAHSSEEIIERWMGKKLRVPPLPPQLAWATPLKEEVERALSINQQRRFADCAEFAAAIQNIAQDHVASQTAIAAFFAANLEAPPSSPASSVSYSHERLVASPSATLRMLPATSIANAASVSGTAARRQATLKMNVTLRMAHVQLPIARDLPSPPVAQHDRTGRLSEAGIGLLEASGVEGESPPVPLATPEPQAKPSARAITPPAPRPPELPSLPRTIAPPMRSSSPPPLAQATTTPPPPELQTRPSQPPLLPRSMTPPTMPRMTLTTAQPTLRPSSLRSTPPPLPVTTTQPPRPRVEASSPVEVGPPPAPRQSERVPGAAPSSPTALPHGARGSRRHWFALALLFGGVVAVGVVIARAARSSAAYARPSVPSASVPSAAAATSGKTPCCTQFR